METRVAVISIIVEDQESPEDINRILHSYRQYIIGRMGIPYRNKGISIISVAIDAPQDMISVMTMVGMMEGMVILHTRRSLVAPSMAAASCNSALTEVMAATKMMEE